MPRDTRASTLESAAFMAPLTALLLSPVGIGGEPRSDRLPTANQIVAFPAR